MKEIKLHRREDAPDFTPRPSPLIRIKSDRECLESLYSDFKKALVEVKKKSGGKIESDNIYTWMCAMIGDFPEHIKLDYILKNEVINK